MSNLERAAGMPTFVYDPRQPELCARIEEAGDKKVRSLGHALLEGAVGSAGLVAAGYALAERNVPLLAISGVVMLTETVRFGIKLNEHIGVCKEEAVLIDELGADPEEYEEAWHQWRDAQKAVE